LVVKRGAGRAGSARHGISFLGTKRKGRRFSCIRVIERIHIQMMEDHMLGWALTFLVVAVIAGLFGFGGVASASAGIAQILFFVFIVLFIVAMIARAARGKPPV
jgi:uncharacterized membrane protein YtjA (UPF0391 family)